MSLAAAVRRTLDGKAKPLGSLGRLEELAVQMGVVQGTAWPVVRDPVVLVFAGDHGAVASGVSAYPSSVTAAMVGVYRQGRAAVNVLADQVGARVVVVDAGVAAELPPGPDLVDAKIGMGTRDWTREPAMSDAQAAAALAAGGAIVDRLADGGTTVLALGEMGIGNSASAALLVHVAAGVPLVVGAGAGLDAAGVARKRALAEAAAGRVGRVAARAALAAVGGFEIAMLTGAILRGAARGVVVVVDGVIVTAAAVLAHAMEPACLGACVFAHRSAEPGHDAMLAHLGVRPLLDLGMRLGEGTGAVLALPLLQAAARLLREMADLAEVV